MKNNKKIIIVGICVAVIATILIGVVVVRNLMSADKASVFCIYDDEQDLTVVYRNDKLIGKIQGQFDSFSRNMNDTGFYLTDDENTLYFVSGSKVIKIGEELSLVTIANYSKEALVLDKNENLYLCDGKKLEKLTDVAVKCASISGNGKVYSYYMEGASYFGSKPGKEKVVEDVCIGFISRDAKIMYGYTVTDEINLWENTYYPSGIPQLASFDLYVIDKEGEKQLLSSEVNSINGLNSEGTEFVFCKNDGTYISVNGEKSEKISEDIIQSINYAGSEYVDYGPFNELETIKEAICVFADEEYNFMACILSDGYKAVKVVDDCATVLDMDADRESFIYLTVEASMCYSKVREGAEAKNIADSVIDGKMSSDGEHIYYTSIADMMELHYVDSNLKDTKVDEFENYWAINVVGEDCYLETDKTYVAKQSKIMEIKEEGSLFYDYIADVTYWQSGTKVSRLKGDKLLELKGEYKNISSYDIAD